MATYTNDLRLKEIATGDEDGTWGTSTNTNLSLIADAFGYGTKELAADANETFTMPDATADGTRALYLKITSAVSLSATRTVTLAPNTVSKVWIIENATTGSQSIEIKQGSGATVTIASGKTAMVYTNGAGSGAAVANALSNTTLVAPVLGTPASATLTNATGLPISTGVSGLGSGVATFLATPSSANLASAVTDETGSGALVFATSPTLVTPALGTPASGTLTSCTGLPLSTGVTGQLPLANGGTGANLTDPNADRILFWDDSAGAVTWLEAGAGLSITGTTITATAVGDVTLSGNNAFTGANTFYNATGQTFGTGTSTQDGLILAGRAGGSSSYRVTLTPTTLTASRTLTLPDAAGVAILDTATQTVTNKRVTPRVSTTTSSATPTINTDTVDMYGLTALAVNITSFTTNLSGTPTDGQKLWIYIVGTAARTITWGASFEASTVALPTTTVTTNRLDVGFVWNAATSKWRCVAVA